MDLKVWSLETQQQIDPLGGPFGSTVISKYCLLKFYTLKHYETYKQLYYFQINDSLKDRVDDWERSKIEADHLIDILRTEKQELLELKTELFNVSIDMCTD